MSSYVEFVLEFGKKFKSFLYLKDISKAKAPYFLVHSYIANHKEERAFYTIESDLEELKNEVIKRDYLWKQYCFDSQVNFFILTDQKEIKKFKEITKIKEGKVL